MTTCAIQNTSNSAGLHCRKLSPSETPWPGGPSSSLYLQIYEARKASLRLSLDLSTCFSVSHFDN